MVATAVAMVQSRNVADVFDIPVPGPEETRGWDHSPDAIGGCYGISWWSYFKDASTGEIYRVREMDGVNGGKGAYARKDEQWRHECYRSLLQEFRDAALTRVPLIRISRHERVLMLGWTSAVLFESAEGKADGVDTKDGLDGGLVGHFHGIPVVCDLTVEDHLPAR